MTLEQYKGLLDSGLTEPVIRILEDAINEKNEELSTKQDLKITELKLQKEIEEFRFSLEKEIEEVRLTLQKEIEIVRKEIVKTENSITKKMMFFFSPIYIALLLFLFKLMF